MITAGSDTSLGTTTFSSGTTITGGSKSRASPKAKLNAVTFRGATASSLNVPSTISSEIRKKTVYSFSAVPTATSPTDVPLVRVNLRT
ncbi:MAG: hypothetical protein PHN29_06940, partial [Endomicrobiaceae bacterium]|nr:hypothetical protein [Endomicrobiaceae bacterium]